LHGHRVVDLQNRLPAALMMRCLAAGCFAVAVALPSLTLAGPEQVHACFEASEGRKVAVTLEVARNPEERQRGLMGRTQLAKHHGMLFIYPALNGPERGFWMYNTQIPLDIAYLNNQREIASIRSMSPCQSDVRSDCPNYPAGVPFRYAVEMNQGFFENMQLSIGDTLNWLNLGPEDCNYRG
ncbi:MAG: DUF192 domain-containing protein, partial [Reinekea sp.]|nr:DUF192 domain-containing protein [Reinekea sp.]